MPNPPLSASDLDAAALQHIAAGDLDAAADHFSRARDAWAADGQAAPAALSEANAAGVRYGQGRFAEALAGFRGAIARREAAGLPHDPYAWFNVASCHAAVSDPESAIEAYGQAAQAAKLAGDLAAEAMAWMGRGQVQGGRQLHDEAARCIAFAIHAWGEAGDHEGVGRGQLHLGEAHYLRGDRRGAWQAWESAVAAIGDAMAPEELVSLLVNMGGVLYELGETERGREVLAAAAQKLPPHLAGSFLDTRLRANRGLVLLAGGRFDESRAELEAALAGYEAVGDFERAAHQLATLSNLLRYEDKLHEAIEMQRRVMELERAHGFRVEEPGGLVYAAIEDRSLHVFRAEEGSAKVAGGGRQVPEAHVGDWPGALQGHLPQAGQRPFLLFTPPMHGTFGPLFPRGATAIASYLNHHGVPSMVVPLSHYVDDYLGSETARSRMLEVIRDAITSLKPRAVGISVTFSFLYPRGLEIAQMVREVAPELPIVIGGPHVSYWDKECLDEAPEIDVVVRGEGEWTALELLHALEAGTDLAEVKGITFRAPDGTVVRTNRRNLGNVLELPEVDFRLLPDAFCKSMEFSGLTSRGCTFRCRYCHEFRYWGGVVREYTPERIVREMERVARDYGNAMCGIDDSMLNMLTPYFFELVEKLGQSKYLPESFGFLTRVDTLSPEGLVAMKKAGINSLSVGMESGSDKVLTAMNKGVSIEKAVGGLTMARDAGVATAGFFIVGHPGDDAVESETTIRFVDRLFTERLVMWMDASMFTPYPGTPFFTNPERHGVEILTMDWSLWRRANRPVAQLENFGADEIYLAYLRLLEVQSRHLGNHAPERRVAAE